MKKILAVLLVSVMVLSVMAVGAGAAEATSTNPANIIGETVYYAKTVVSFDEEGIVDSFVPDTSESNGADLVVVDGGIKGKALKMAAYDTAGWAQCYVNIPEMDASAYDGIMYYLDMSKVALNADNVAKGQANGLGLRLYSNFAPEYTWTRNNIDPVVQGHEIKAYYLADGTTEWKMADESKQNGERIMFPENFKGWVYIPFSSYVARKGAEGVPQAGFYGAEGFAKIGFMAGMYQKGEGNEFIFDEVQLIKMGQTTEPTETVETEPVESDTQVTDPVASETQKVEDTTAKVEDSSVATTASTTAPADDKGGCGSSITVASVSVVMTAILGSACALKKKRK